MRAITSPSAAAAGLISMDAMSGECGTRAGLANHFFGCKRFALLCRPLGRAALGGGENNLDRVGRAMGFERVLDPLEGEPMGEELLSAHRLGREQRHGLRKLVLIDH